MGKKCEFINCDKYASYNILNEKPKFCSEHKTENMINVKHKKCLKCGKIPYYNLPYEKIGLYCDEHKLDGMINIKSIICNEKGCKKQSSYNLPSEKAPKFCSLHKLEGMIHLNHVCKHINCTLLASFNYEGKKSGLYCSEHKLDSMIDINHKKCLECAKSALFGFEKPLYCSEHKKDNMMNIVTKTCIYENCKIIPCYNYKDKKNGLYCKKHKLENMVDVKSAHCIEEGCFRRAMFNNNGEKPVYCKQHKKDNMTNQETKKCKFELCDVYVGNNKKYDGYCFFCYIHLFPESKITTNFKTKEKNVVDFIKNKYNNYDWIYDKKIYDGCSKRRPDLLLDLGYHILIIEIDENQHCKYDTSCENKRLMEISKDLNHRNIVFIRFNPDKYYDKKNVLIDSCWKVNKKGLLQIKDVDKWNERLKELSNKIDFWINNNNDKMINIENLYFDKNI